MKTEDMIGPIVIIGGIALIGYLFLKKTGLLGVSDALGAAAGAILPSDSGEALGGLSGAAIGGLGGITGLIGGEQIGQALGPNSYEETPGFAVGGALGGIAGPFGMLLGSQLGKTISGSITQTRQPVISITAEMEKLRKTQTHASGYNPRQSAIAKKVTNKPTTQAGYFQAAIAPGFRTLNNLGISFAAAAEYQRQKNKK